MNPIPIPKIVQIATIAIFCINIVAMRAVAQVEIVSSIPPGFVAAGTEITLSCQNEGIMHYTLDGSHPITSSSAKIYNNNSFTVSEDGTLLVKAVVENAGLFGSVYSFLWLPKEPLVTPFWGLNVSLALNGEPFGYQLSEADTRNRMLKVLPLTKWIRTFGTVRNGQEYINQIAKDAGLRTMIGLYITNDSANNKAQIAGLQQILAKEGQHPDLIAVGNETSLLGVNPVTLASCIDTVREMLLEQDLVIPIGSVDVASVSWESSVFEKLDFIGVNIYNGTWDNVPENQMLDAMKQRFTNSVAAFLSKLVLLSETGTPYYDGNYAIPSGGEQTASKEKAANYLCGFLDWIKHGDVPAFYFEAYNEPIKVQESGHSVEGHFGIMDGNMEIHPRYRDCIANHTNIPPINSIGSMITLYPNPTTHTIFLETAGAIKVYNMEGVVLQELFGSQVNLSAYPPGIYLLHLNGKWSKVVKK